MPEAVLFGGPLDGRRVRLRTQLSFIWIDVRKGNICYRARKQHRVLYRLERAGRYVFAMHTHAPCGGCGAWNERVDGHNVSCSLCGGALVIS